MEAIYFPVYQSEYPPYNSGRAADFSAADFSSADFNTTSTQEPEPTQD
ncbi:hypothetical protein [Hymenobacter fodinae]|nr:hypothetical protein [Hymenobacter fodinae]